MKKALALLFALIYKTVYAANPEATIGSENCKIFNPHPIMFESVTWSGGCKDGFAHGTGTLDWLLRFRLVLHYEGEMQRGRYHGTGYVKSIDGGYQREGMFVNGLLDGYGIEEKVDGSRYEGEWKAGKHDGQGSAIYATGGDYQGQWRQGRFHGRGKASYIGGRVVEGEFVEGVLAAQSARDARTESASDTRDPSATLSAPPSTALVARSAPIPFRRVWDAMTKPEQDSVREKFPMLEVSDEPPYPARGPAAIFRLLTRGQLVGPTDGALRMLVTIDKAGAPTQVKVVSSASPEMTAYASRIVMTEMYKPALCAGNPCDMVYPFEFNFRY